MKSFENLGGVSTYSYRHQPGSCSTSVSPRTVCLDRQYEPDSVCPPELAGGGSRTFDLAGYGFR